MKSQGQEPSWHFVSFVVQDFLGSHRRIGYIRAWRHLVSRPMREFTSWLRAVAKDE
jgi:hypothetical protein